MNNDVGVLSVITELQFPKAEKESGQFPSRLRLTADTCDSLRENVESGSIQVLVEKFNNRYQEVRQALIAAETEAAEQQVRADVMAGENAQQMLEREKAAELAKIRMDQAIARASSVEVVVPKISKLNVEPVNTGTIFGKNEKGYVSTTVSGMIPKALMVPGNFAKIYGKIGKNVSLYRLADKIKEVPKTADIAPVVEPSNGEVVQVQEQAQVQAPKQTANWHSLFDGIRNEEPVVQIGADVQERRVEAEPVMPEQKGITSEDLADRRLKAQIGDELADIRRLREGIASTTPFNSGLLERENALLQMLSELTGIEVDAKKLEVAKQNGITEFQKMVDSLIGYRAPLTPEEHTKKAEELEAYYSDPQVVETMWALQMKNRLYDMNRPEAHEIISAAERIDNERRASMSTAVEILDSVEPAFIPKTNYVASQPPVSNTEKSKLVEDSFDKPQMRQDLDGKADLVNGAEEQARMLQESNERADLVNGAEEQARMLQESNEKADLVNGAEEQARMLQESNERVDLVNGAEEQARMLQESNERVDLVNGAEEQARMLQTAETVSRASETEVADVRNKPAGFKSTVFENARRIISDRANDVKATGTTPLEKQPAKSYIVIDSVPRYVSMNEPSKPIKLNVTQIGKLRRNSNKASAALLATENHDGNIRDMLVSLRTQLDELNVGADEELERPFSHV